MNSGICICANDAERADGPGSRRWVATGPSQALVTSAGGAGAQWPRDHQGWTLGRASGSQGWTPRWMDGHSSAWVLAAAMLAAARSTGLSLLAHMPLAAPVAKTRRDRHDGAPRLVALTGWRRITKVLPALL